MYESGTPSFTQSTFQTLSSLLQELPEEGRERLERSLERTEKGFAKDLRSPLYGSQPRKEIVALCADAIGEAQWEELRGIDNHEIEKVGSFSIMLPYSERKESVMEYWHQRWDADAGALQEAISRVASILPARSLRVASFQIAYGLMPKDTSLGLPWLTRDRSYAQTYFQRAVQISSPEDVYPCVLYWRGQAAGENKVPKQRVVWGFDHAETILGATLLYPMINTLRSKPGFSAWLGDVYVDEAVTRILHKADGRRIISMDYSGFDSSLSVNLLDAVDNVMAGWFVEPGSSRCVLVGRIGNTIPLVVPGDVLSGRNGGMPSGSVLTNMRDTIANLIAGVYAGIRMGCPLEDYELLGDDSVYLFQGDPDPSEVSHVVAELGLDSNPDKQFVSTRSAHYLQRWHSLDYESGGVCRGVRSPFRALNGMMSYERFRQGWNKYMDSARWIMQCENVKNDPRFKSFVAFVVEGDEILRSGIDPSVIFARAGGSDAIRATLSIASFPFNIQDPEKVNEFYTTEVIRSLL